MQPNPLKGEVRFKVGEDEFVLAYPINTVIDVADHFGKPFEEVRADFLANKMTDKEVRTFVRFGFAARWPGVTDEEAGEVIGRVGDAEFGILIAQCFVATFGLRAQEAGEDADGPPAPSATGTGKIVIELGGATGSAASPSS